MSEEKKPLPIHIPTVLKAMTGVWWIPIIFVVLGAAIGAFVALTIGKKLYRCRMIFLYSPKRIEQIAQFSHISLETYVSLIKLPSNLREMGKRLMLSEKAVNSIFRINMSKKQKLLTLTVETDSPEKAYQYSKVISSVFLKAQVEKRRAVCSKTNMKKNSNFIDVERKAKNVL